MSGCFEKPLEVGVESDRYVVEDKTVRKVMQGIMNIAYKRPMGKYSTSNTFNSNKLLCIK